MVLFSVVSFSSAVLRSKEKIETNRYKFKTKQGSFVTLQSQWFSFINPWTKEMEFIVSTSKVVSWVSAAGNILLFVFHISHPGLEPFQELKQFETSSSYFPREILVGFSIKPH